MSSDPVSRKKSCGECAKAKRKCGMEIPKCRRCAKKNIDCCYPNPRASVSDMTFPELDFPFLNDLMNDPGMLPWSGNLQPQLGVGGIETPQYSTTDPLSAPQASVPDYLRDLENDLPKHMTLPRAEVEAAQTMFKSYPEKWLREGKAPFIHPRLYVSSMPKPLQDAYAACAIYSTKTEQNALVAFTVIEAKANELLRSPNQPSWTPLDLLAAVQALLIFQLIRLFDGDIRQRNLAEQVAPVLESWTEDLNVRTSAEQKFTTSTAPSWHAWIFGESVRRTITISIMLSGIYALIRNGYCTRGDAVSANSFTAQRKLWDANSHFEWDQARQSCSPHWINKMSFDTLLQEASGSELDDFGMVMLITYKGKDQVDRWLATGQQNPERGLVCHPDMYTSVRDAIPEAM